VENGLTMFVDTEKPLLQIVARVGVRA